MKGDKKVIAQLNEALYLEPGAVNQYWLHYRLLDDWGYTPLQKAVSHGSNLAIMRILLEHGADPNLPEEGIAPAEIGWGTHERHLPANAWTYDYGPANQICLSEMGMNTYVHSWVPTHGEIIGMVIRHGEAFTICDHLTVRDASGRPIYRPTVHYAYHPSDAAIVSLWELRMRNYVMQPKTRIMRDEIIDGMDELGVLILGHDLNGWWTGSQLDIHEARKHVTGHNATTLQVAASLIAAITWMIRNPDQGLCEPDDLPHEEILAVANPYLGTTVSEQTDWTPLKNRNDIFSPYNGKRTHPDDVWQFGTFLV